MNWKDYIEQRPDVMMGKPVFAGTRLTVEHIMREWAAGATDEQLMAEYPRLRAEHLRAAHAYAADVLASEEVLFG